jgi:hypothetical protein
MKRLLLACTALFAVSSSAQVLTTPSFSVLDLSVNEKAGTVAVGIYKNGNNGAPATITVTEANGTAINGSDYTRISGRLTFQPTETYKIVNLPIINDTIHEDTEYFYFQIGPYANAVINRGTAKITIVDDDPAPVPVPTPPPTPASTWVAINAPLNVGSWAFLKSQGPCCYGLIVKIVGIDQTQDADPTKRQNRYAVQYYTDPSGNFPITNPYWVGNISYNFIDGLQAVAPTKFASSTLTDHYGYVRTTAQCSAWGGGDNRSYAAGTVLQMIVSPNTAPHTDPSVWGYTADNRRVQGIVPLAGDTTPGYVYNDCIEGIKPI